MKKNIGMLDRLIRLGIAIILLIGAWFATTLASSLVLLAFGIFTLFEAAFSWCAFYQLIGRNSCPIDKR